MLFPFFPWEWPRELEERPSDTRHIVRCVAATPLAPCHSVSSWLRVAIPCIARVTTTSLAKPRAKPVRCCQSQCHSYTDGRQTTSACLRARCSMLAPRRGRSFASADSTLSPWIAAGLFLHPLAQRLSHKPACTVRQSPWHTGHLSCVSSPCTPLLGSEVDPLFQCSIISGWHTMRHSGYSRLLHWARVVSSPQHPIISSPLTPARLVPPSPRDSRSQKSIALMTSDFLRAPTVCFT